MARRVILAASKKRPSERIDEAPARTERKPLPLGAGARMNARVVLALVLCGLAVWTAAGFLPALIWATILAVALWPLYLKFAARFSSGPSSLAAVHLYRNRCAGPVHSDVACRLPDRAARRRARELAEAGAREWG